MSLFGKNVPAMRRDRIARRLKKDYDRTKWPDDWRFIDPRIKPGEFHVAHFVVGDEPFPFAGFDVDPMTPFAVEWIRVGNKTVPMPYPFAAARLAGAMSCVLIPPGVSIAIRIKNETSFPVEATIELLDGRVEGIL